MSIPSLPVLGVAAIAFAGTVALLLQRLNAEERVMRRIRAVQVATGIDTPEARGGSWAPLSLISRLGEALARSGLLSAGTIEDLQRTLQIAGFRGRGGLGLFVGAKLLLFFLVPGLTLLLMSTLDWHPPFRLGLVMGSAVVGLLAPDYFVRARRRRHLRALDRGLPDALDMLVICSEAGLGLEPAIERVGHEIRHAHPAIADEMLLTTQEMRVNADRRVALLNMGTRTGLDTLRRLGTTLVQTLQYGTPLSQALRTLSAEMRQEALTRFEARAARLPVLMTLPMIVFILPCVFMIVGGPAIVRVLHTLHH